MEEANIPYGTGSRAAAPGYGESMSTSDFRALEQRYSFEVYPKRDIVITRGEGALLWDDRGNEYIDCTAGVGVANVGHANPAVAEAVCRQAETLVTCPGIFYNDVRAALMAKLAAVTPEGLARAFLCNSGTAAVEAAIKFARLATGRQKVVSVMRGFHGRTLGALSATFKYRDEFEPLIPGHAFVPLNNVDKLDAALEGETACLILELVQGEGGVRPADAEYVRRARELCTERGVLLVVDEIQTGLGRCGQHQSFHRRREQKNQREDHDCRRHQAHEAARRLKAKVGPCEPGGEQQRRTERQ